MVLLKWSITYFTRNSRSSFSVSGSLKLQKLKSSLQRSLPISVEERNFKVIQFLLVKFQLRDLGNYTHMKDQTDELFISSTLVSNQEIICAFFLVRLLRANISLACWFVHPPGTPQLGRAERNLLVSQLMEAEFVYLDFLGMEFQVVAPGCFSMVW